MGFVLLFLGVSNSVSLLLTWCMGTDWRRSERYSLSWLTRHVKAVSSRCLLPHYDTNMLYSIVASVRNEKWQKRELRSLLGSLIYLSLCHFILLQRKWEMSYFRHDRHSHTYWFYHQMEDSETNEINAESMRMPIPRRELGWFGFYQDNMQARKVEWPDFFRSSCCYWMGINLRNDRHCQS